MAANYLATSFKSQRSNILTGLGWKMLSLLLLGCVEVEEGGATLIVKADVLEIIIIISEEMKAQCASLTGPIDI